MIVEVLERLTPLLLGLVGAVVTGWQYKKEERKRTEKLVEDNKKRLELERESKEQQLELLKQELCEKEEHTKRNEELHRRGMNSLIRNEILTICRAALKNGYIDIYTKEVLSELYSIYKAYGGNHMVDELMERVSHIDIIDADI